MTFAAPRALTEFAVSLGNNEVAPSKFTTSSCATTIVPGAFRRYAVICANIPLRKPSSNRINITASATPPMLKLSRVLSLSKLCHAIDISQLPIVHQFQVTHAPQFRFEPMLAAALHRHEDARVWVALRDGDDVRKHPRICFFPCAVPVRAAGTLFQMTNQPARVADERGIDTARVIRGGLNR